jgi:hypothetical protein
MVSTDGLLGGKEAKMLLNFPREQTVGIDYGRKNSTGYNGILGVWSSERRPYTVPAKLMGAETTTRQPEVRSFRKDTRTDESLDSTCLGVCRPFLSSDFCPQIFVLRFCRLKLFKYFLGTRLQNEHALRALGSN